MQSLSCFLASISCTVQLDSFNDCDNRTNVSVQSTLLEVGTSYLKPLPNLQRAPTTTTLRGRTMARPLGGPFQGDKPGKTDRQEGSGSHLTPFPSLPPSPTEAALLLISPCSRPCRDSPAAGQRLGQAVTEQRKGGVASGVCPGQRAYTTLWLAVRVGTRVGRAWALESPTCSCPEQPYWMSGVKVVSCSSASACSSCPTRLGILVTL